MNHNAATYTLNYDPLDQQINFEGILRPVTEDEISKILNYLKQVHVSTNTSHTA
jgi:hypothetical protein